MADFNGKEPAYLQIANRYKHQIRTGELQPGDQLPSEAKLCAENGVSRTVARQALSRLREDGYAYSHQGKGNFVAELSKAEPEPHSAEYEQITETLTALLQDVRRLGERLDDLESLVRTQSAQR